MTALANIALGLAAKANGPGAVYQTDAYRASPVGTRIIAGRTAQSVATGGTGITDRLIITVPADVVAVQPILANGKNASGNTGAPATMIASVAALPNKTDAAANAATWNRVQVGGANGWAFPAAAAAGRRAYTVCDWFSMASVPRDDGGSYPLIGIMAYVVSTADPLCLMGSGSDNFSDWANDSSGYVIRMDRASGQLVGGSEASFSAAASPVQSSMIIGLRYRLKTGRVVTVMVGSDSNGEGREPTLIGKGWGFYATAGKRTRSGHYLEFLNNSVSSSTMSQWNQNLTDLLAAGLVPNVAFVPKGSCNNVSGTIDAAEVQVMDFYFTSMLQKCAENNIKTIPTTWQPETTTTFPWGNSDGTYRRADNAKLVAEGALGTYPVFDISAILSGTDDGTGQVQIKPAYNLDNTHINALGNADTGNAAFTLLNQILN